MMIPHGKCCGKRLSQTRIFLDSARDAGKIIVVIHGDISPCDHFSATNIARTSVIRCFLGILPFGTVFAFAETNLTSRDRCQVLFTLEMPGKDSVHSLVGSAHFLSET